MQIWILKSARYRTTLKPHALRQLDKAVRACDIETVAEVSLEQSSSQAPLQIWRRSARMRQQDMRTPRIRHPLNTGKVETDALLLADLLKLTLRVSKTIHIAETLEQIFRPRAALRRDGRIQLEREPDNLDWNLRSSHQRSRQTSLSDETPRTDEVGKNFDAHEREHTQAVA